MCISNSWVFTGNSCFIFFICNLNLQVIVGARDSLYRLSLEGLTKLEKATWEATDSNVGLCTAKGQSEEDCRNYIKVLVIV
jgi:hypothetical protein